MRSKEFRSLLETASHVVSPKTQQLHENSNSVKNLYEGFSQNEVDLMEAVSEVLEIVEKDLNITMTEEEIRESTNMILQLAANEILIEEVEKDVGFVLTEEEQNYVLQQLLG